MGVPFIDLKRLESGFLERWQTKLLELSAEMQFIGGIEVERLERLLVEDCQSKFAVSCANGTDALQVALRAAGVVPGDLVLLPDLTFWSTFEAIVNLGAQPITVDIDAEDLQMDYELFCQAYMKYKPKAAILVHLYGWGSQNLQKFRDFSQENKVILIEDGAQAYGTLYRKESIFKAAQIASLSFYPAKVFGGAGDGGALLCRDEDLAQKVRTLCNHGRQGHYSYDFVGWNSRLDSLQAAYLNLVHAELPKRLESRRKTAKIYQAAFADQKELRCLDAPQDFTENGYLNVMLMDNKKRTKCIENLQAHKIGYGITYPQSISEQNGALAHLKAKLGGKAAKGISQSVLNLPLFPYIRQEELEEVLNITSRRASSKSRQLSFAS